MHSRWPAHDTTPYPDMPRPLTREDAAAALAAIGKYAKNFLPLLFNLYGTSAGARKSRILDVAQQFVHIADGALVNKLFHTLQKKLAGAATASSSAPEQSAGALFDVTLTVVARLSRDNLAALYAFVRPLLSVRRVRPPIARVCLLMCAGTSRRAMRRS